MRTRRFSSPCFSHCQELATTEGSQAVESRHGLRGVRVGEASHPGPPRRRISRPVEGRDVIPRMYFHGSTQVDEDSDVADVTQVLQRPRRGGRRVSSDSDVPLVRGSRFAVLTESDDQSDIEPLMCPAGQTRDEDDVNTVPASSGAVAAQLGAISGDPGQFVSVPTVPGERVPVREFDLTRCDSDEDIQRDGHVITESVTESCREVVRPSRRLRLMWSQEQVAVDSHDERLVRVRQMVQEEVRGGQPQVTDRDVHGVIALFSNLARRVGAVPRGAPLPAAIRSQRWSPLMVPLLWSAAGEDQSVPIVEW